MTTYSPLLENLKNLDLSAASPMVLTCVLQLIDIDTAIEDVEQRVNEYEAARAEFDEQAAQYWSERDRINQKYDTLSNIDPENESYGEQRRIELTALESEYNDLVKQHREYPYDPPTIQISRNFNCMDCTQTLNLTNLDDLKVNVTQIVDCVLEAARTENRNAVVEEGDFTPPEGAYEASRTKLLEGVTILGLTPVQFALIMAAVIVVLFIGGMFLFFFMQK